MRTNEVRHGQLILIAALVPVVLSQWCRRGFVRYGVMSLVSLEAIVTACWIVADIPASRNLDTHDSSTHTKTYC